MKSSFVSPLRVDLIDGKEWRLALAYQYHIGSKRAKAHIAVPAGFIHDFASIPKFLLLILPWWAKFNKSAVLHDFLYRFHLYSRAQADLYFYEAMLVAFRHHRSGKFVAWLEYKAVRWFGHWAYKGGQWPYGPPQHPNCRCVLAGEDLDTGDAVTIKGNKAFKAK